MLLYLPGKFTSCRIEENPELTKMFFSPLPLRNLLLSHSCCLTVVCVMTTRPHLFLSFFSLLDPKDPIAIERLNLMNMAKLSIKGLIESALNLGRTLDSDYAPLQQFFVVMEHCLKHGLKSMYSTLHTVIKSVKFESRSFKMSCMNIFIQISLRIQPVD